jgi:hypothetical protein
MQINPDGTKTMETGSEKMIYQWNDDLNIVTQQTEEFNQVNLISLAILFLLQYQRLDRVTLIAIPINRVDF